jgi:regulator of cell morphogenesis and NO signaling
MADKVARVHGDKNAKLAGLASAVRDLAAMLEPHLDWEEKVLFPKMMAGGAPQTPAELAEMHEEHVAVGAELEQIRELSDGFSVPEWGCATYRSLFAGLEELEGDVHRHVHLENNVLMPRFTATAATEDRSCS